MRKRINRNAICSSDNYKASRKAHLEMLKEHHKSFNVSMLSKSDTIDSEGLSIKRQIALDNRKVKVSVFGKICTITMKEFKERFEHLGWKILD